jgi:hypothetical protein
MKYQQTCRVTAFERFTAYDNHANIFQSWFFHSKRLLKNSTKFYFKKDVGVFPYFTSSLQKGPWTVTQKTNVRIKVQNNPKIWIPFYTTTVSWLLGSYKMKSELGNTKPAVQGESVIWRRHDIPVSKSCLYPTYIYFRQWNLTRSQSKHFIEQSHKTYEIYKLWSVVSRVFKNRLIYTTFGIWKK